MLVKDFYEHIFLFALLLFIVKVLPDSMFLVTITLVCIFWYIRVLGNSVILVCILLLLSQYSFYNSDIPTMEQGRIISVHSSYYVVQNKNEKVILYTNQNLSYDDQVLFTAFPEKIELQKTFYSNTFSERCYRNHIYYSINCEDVTIIQQSHSIRSFLLRACRSIENENTRVLVQKIILGINDAYDNESFLYQHGYSLTGIIAFLDYILRYLISDKKRNITKLIISIILNIIYAFPIGLMHYMLYYLSEYITDRRDIRIGLTAVILLYIYPDACFSAGFLIPITFRICSHFFRGRKAITTLFIFNIQSILFHSIDPVMTLLFMYFRPLLGLAWVCAILYLLTSSQIFISILFSISYITSFLNMFEIPGSMIGFGYVGYLLLLTTFHRYKYKDILACILFVLFQYTGLFHPFAEITFINVGQGDSILIRDALNLTNILIDTGKPSQYIQLSSYLEAKCIRNLDALIVTHADSDHAGNTERITQSYNPRNIIEEHTEQISIGRFMFYDLNQITDDDENRSSIVMYTKINGLTYLFMGDADEVSEGDIVERNNQLRCDVLKLSHHGSKTGSSEDFLNTVRPKIGIISSGPYRIYHHPSEEVIQRLLKRHIAYFDTKQEGDISIICISKNLNLLVTASGKIGIIHA